MKRAISLLIFISISKLNAHERLFTYSYDTDYLPVGLFEVEQWITLKSGKENGIYNLWKMRTEFEYAINPKTHIALYLNYSSLYYYYYDDVLNKPITEQYTKFDGIDLAIVHRFSSPRQKLGFGIYGEIKYRMNKYEFEEKLLFSKYFLNERVLTTLNVVFEQELENVIQNSGNFNIESESKLIIPFGIAYKFGNFAIGLEAWSHSKWLDQPFKALFLGPVFHYSTSKFWITFTITPQITNILDEHEKLESRMILSIIF
ncbi:MAG: hypothetical protein ABIL37_05015 [candidate division WOR-3 bacterium]